MILITYASRNGSPVGIANKIGETLINDGFTADVRQLIRQLTSRSTML